MIIGTVAILAVGIVGVRLVTGQTDVAEAGAARRELLGMATRAVTDADEGIPRRAGVLVTAVQAHGLAEAAGLASGDLITAVNGVPVPGEIDYAAALDAHLGAGAVTFAVVRGSDRLDVRLAPDMAATYNSLGIAYLNDGRQSEARAAFATALELEPDFAEAHYNIGNLHADAGDQTAAIASFKAALEQNAGFREARFRLAEMYAEAGRPDEAIAELKQAAALDPDATAERALRPVETVLATVGSIQREVATSGTIEAVADVAVYAKMAGRVEDVPFDEGARVEADDVVAILEHEELELQVIQAEAAAMAADAAREQAEKLAEIRVRANASQTAAALNAAEAALKLVRDLAETRARSQTDQAEAGLAVIQANLEKLRRGLRDEERGQIRAALSQAAAGRQDADANLNRMQVLFDSGAVSRQTLDSARTHFDVARAQHQAARQQWALAEKGARSEDIRSLEAQVRQAEAALMIARKQADSQTWESDIAMAAAQVEQARAGHATAQSLVDAAAWEAEITGARAAETQADAALALARKRLADAFIKAPIAGIVARRNIDPGDMANPAGPLLDIVQMDTVQATVRVLEADLADIRVGGPARVLLRTLELPVDASITRISPTVDRVARTAEIHVEMRNPGGAARPGMFARVLLPTHVRPNAVLLPRDAVVEDAQAGRAHVYVVADGRARRVSIALGLTEGATVEVVDGIAAGAEVVYSGGQSLRDGDFVKVVRRVDAP